MEINGHRQRGNLTFRNGVITHAIDEEANLLFSQRMAVTFFANYFLWQEQGNPLVQGNQDGEQAVSDRLKDQ